MKDNVDDELPPGWVQAQIGTLCDLKNGRAFKPTDWSSRGLPIVRIQNLNNPSAKFNCFEGSAEERYMLEGGELLFAWSGTPGTSFGAHVWRGGKAVLNQHIFRVDFDQKSLDKRFFRYAINQKLDELIGVAHGGVGLRHVTKGTFENTEITLPPRAEQKRIADKLEAVLGRVDACRARLDRVPDLLKRFRQSVLAAATSGQLTKAYEDGIPNGWKKVPFEDLLADKEKLSYGVLKPGDHDTDGVPMYRVVDIGAWGKRNETERSYISNSLSREFTRTIVEEGDILLSVMATIGRAMVATKDMAGANVNRAIAVIKPDRAKVDSSFLMYYFLSPALVTEFEERSLGSAQVRINLGDLRQFRINLPPLSEQVEIVRRVEALFKLADRIEARLATAQRLVERLTPATLSKGFRGDLVPQDPNDEPASKLLERLNGGTAERASPRTKGRKAKTTA